MTEISTYITSLRQLIRDTESITYTDANLTEFITRGVYELQGTKYYIKFKIVGTTVVKDADSTDPSEFDKNVILLQTQILIKYAELFKYSRESIIVKDIRGSIDTSNIAKQLSEDIKLMEKRLEDIITNINKNKNRAAYGPKNMTFQDYTPTGSFDEVTFKTKGYSDDTDDVTIGGS